MKNDPIDRSFDSLRDSHSTEVLIIGAGITGLSTALELVARGHRVTVCEAEAIGAGTTAGSSGHLDAHPEMGPRQLIEQLGIDDAKRYTALRLGAIDAIESRSRDCDFVRLPAYFYSESAEDRSKLQAELDAAQQIGLVASWSEQIPLAAAVCGYRLEHMARFDCGKYLKCLTELAVDQGVTIFERTLVEGPTEEQPSELPAGQGRVTFEHVVCATHCNYTKAKLLYAAVPPYQSYIVVARVRKPPADALFWDNSEPYHYVRRVNSQDANLILAGGCDHRTGIGEEMAATRNIEDWVDQRFGIEEVVQRWSAELFEPTDGLPMIGLAPGKKNIYVATGLSGVGLTLGTAAAELIADALEGKSNPLHKLLSPSRLALSKEWAAEQLTTVGNLAERVLPAHHLNPNELGDGQGDVGKSNGHHAAVCRDEHGCLHRLKPICTHMGGVVHWNEAEQTWDCPVHGGRFTAEGKRIYGPPEEDLEALPDDSAKGD